MTCITNLLCPVSGSDNVSIGLRTAVPCGHDSVEMLIEFNEIVRQLARDENLLLYDDSFDVLTSIYFNNEHEVSNAGMCYHDYMNLNSIYSQFHSLNCQ